MTDSELDAWLAARRADRAARRAELERAVRAVLVSGGTVRESNGAWTIDWNCATTTFVEDCRNAEYLTRHLMARHDGFGWRLVPVFCV